MARLHTSFIAATALSVAAALTPMPQSDSSTSVPWKVLLWIGAAGAAAYSRSLVTPTRNQAQYDFISTQATLAAHAETAAVVAQVQAEQQAEQAVMQALPPSIMPAQTIEHHANPNITVNLPEQGAPLMAANVSQSAAAQGVEGAPQPVGDGSKLNPRQDWESLIKELFSAKNSDGTYLYPCVFLTGRQGSGKTTFLKYIQQFLDGSVTVIDSHFKKGNWPGCKVIGAGKNYMQIEKYLRDVMEETERLYSRYANLADPGFKPVTIIAEEMTNWDGEMEDDKIAGQFLKSSLSDFRKIMYRLISVAHADTNTARGNAKGTARMREEGEVRIELVKKGLALISMPGQPDFYLQFPNLEDYTPTAQVETTSKDKPSQVLELKSNGTALADAICEIYQCDRNSDDFQRAKLEIMHSLS